MDTKTRKTESWIEVPSRDSSASLSSATDEVITHGLRVGGSEPQQHQRRRRRPLLSSLPPHLSTNNTRSASRTSSSQDEYTESESESDRVMTSSNEANSTGHSSAEHSQHHSDSAADAEDDDDENATALGTRPRDDSCFTPQPNAFSHPPASQESRLESVSGSYFPPSRNAAAGSASRRASFPAQQARHLNAALSPSQPHDHDAALRASLNTLLSCAAAARSLPRVDESPQGVSPSDQAAPATKPSTGSTKARPKPASARVDPNSIRIFQGPPRPTSNSSRPRQPSSSPSDGSMTSEKGKRKASRSSSKDRRAAKRLRSVGADQAISPTLLTWVVSAGVLVLVSALSFSAGVSVGMEAEKIKSNGWSGIDHISNGSRRGTRSGLGLRRRLFNGAVRAVAA
ncbi:MAG: hypothetical protein Q9162_003815 [Coniocarpon cinnabarinum]